MNCCTGWRRIQNVHVEFWQRFLNTLLWAACWICVCWTDVGVLSSFWKQDEAECVWVLKVAQYEEGWQARCHCYASVSVCNWLIWIVWKNFCRYSLSSERHRHSWHLNSADKWSQSGSQDPPMTNQINLRGHDMINKETKHYCIKKFVLFFLPLKSFFL